MTCRLLNLVGLLSALLFPHVLLASNLESVRLQTDTGSISVEELRGSIVYLDFWASWCEPCRKSFVWMNAMNRKYATQGLKILAVNVDNQSDDAKRFLQRIPAEFQIAYDANGQLASTMQLKAMPSAFLIDRGGRIIATHLGFRQELTGEYEMEIQKALITRTTDAQP